MTFMDMIVQGLLHSFLVWANQMASEPSAPSFSALLTELEGEIHPAWELLKWVCFKSSDHTLPAIGLAIMEKFTGPDHPDHPKMLRLCDDIKTEMELLLGENNTLVFSTGSTTQKVSTSRTVQCTYTQCVANYTGFINNNVLNSSGSNSYDRPQIAELF